MIHNRVRKFFFALAIVIVAACVFPYIMSAYRVISVERELIIYTNQKRSDADSSEIFHHFEALKSRNPVEDAKHFFRIHDRRFLGIDGLATLAPGAPEGYAFSDSMKVLLSGSDLIESSFHGELRRRAYSYAERYNREMGRLRNDIVLKVIESN